MKKESIYPDQIVPLLLTAGIFLVVVASLYLEILLLNSLAIGREKIVPVLRVGDILIGLTIYLKTSIDFAIFIGQLMHKHPGWKNRVMIEIGTALGNAGGTLAILLVWDIFREVHFLMAIMIFVASAVLLRMAEDSLEHGKGLGGEFLNKLIAPINRLTSPVMSKIVPDMKVSDSTLKKSMKQLFTLSLTIPFILGLDDFAGYIPLFNIVNVFGFGTGVFLGHMVLNIFLFIKPAKTTAAVQNPIIATLGAYAFVGLAAWGTFEATKLLFGF